MALSKSFPDEVFLKEGDSLRIRCLIPLKKERTEKQDGRYNLTLSTPAGIKVKDISVKEIKPDYLVPAGIPFGIKMFSKGVMVVGLSDLSKDGRLYNPAKDAGIKCGDIILKLDGKEVSSNSDVAKIIDASEGHDVAVTLRSHGKLRTVSLKPHKAKDGFKAGMWVRDSSAGIGTMTYFDPVTGAFGGLGHPVCDVDTGEIIPIDHGKALSVSINSVKKGVAGVPGELRGSFSNKLIGSLDDNRESGIFGTSQSIRAEAKPMETASKSEIKEGKAYILTTIEGTEPKAYEISIEKINLNDKNKTKNMVIKIKDPRLLEKTGGIVQGMSGSPIIQDGKLIGAVTHVLVNNPEKGYGIFIENMVKAAR